MTGNTLQLSPDEKLMAALSHLFGILVALVIWMTQREKSRFVKFQALQALAFEVVVMLVMGIFFTCLSGVMFVVMFGSAFWAAQSTSFSDNMAPFLFPFMTFACIFPFSFLRLAVRIFASVSIFNGHNFHYPILGPWLERFLEPTA
jgi:uncharacterized Tic20 family protein